MNRSGAKNILANIEIIKAFAEGKEIQYRPHPGHDWENLSLPNFCYPPECYRIKPEPLELWVNVYDGPDGGVMRGCVYPSRERAENKRIAAGRTVLMREVMD